MIHTPNDLWQALRQHQAITAQAQPYAPAPETATDQDRPWYITALLAVSAWFAAGFILIFCALLFRSPSAVTLGVLGATAMAAAWALFKLDRQGVFLSQLALAVSMAGQALLIYALNFQHSSVRGIFATAAVVQLALIALMPSRAHRLLSTLFAMLAWPLALGLKPQASQVIVALLMWLPPAALVWTLVRKEAVWMARGWQPIVRPVFTGLVIGLACATTLSVHSFSMGWSAAAAAPSWFALWPLLCALIAVYALTCAFAMRSKALMGLCIASAFIHLSHFYYQLSVSLLFKSALMLGAGAILLLAAKLLHRQESA
jgi:hypothetical protein